MEDDEARAILREHGEEPPPRGRLGPQWKARAEDLRQGPPSNGEARDTYDGGVSESDFTETAAAEPPAVRDVPERKPRRVRAAAPSIADRLRGKGKAGKKPARKKLPRVPVTQFIETFWAGVGSWVARIDAPVGRVLIMQSSAAGDILEDTVRDTAADRALQPIVRNYDRGRKVAALVGPPMIVAAIEMAQRLPREQMEARMMLLHPMLVSSLMLWDDVAAEKAAERMERHESQRPKLEQAQRIAALIFAEVPEPEQAAA